MGATGAAKRDRGAQGEALRPSRRQLDLVALLVGAGPDEPPHPDAALARWVCAELQPATYRRLWVALFGDLSREEVVAERREGFRLQAAVEEGYRRWTVEGRPTTADIKAGKEEH